MKSTYKENYEEKNRATWIGDDGVTLFQEALRKANRSRVGTK